MTDVTFAAKDGLGDQIVFKAKDEAELGLTPYKIEDPVQRAALLSALSALGTAIAEVEANTDGLETLLDSIITALGGTLAVSVASLPLPAGAATAAGQAALLTALSGTFAISAAALPLPAGAATAVKQNDILAALAGTLAVSAASLPLPAGAATASKQDSILTALGQTLPVSVASLPLPSGAASESKLETVRALLAGTLAVSASALPLPTGAASEAKMEAIRLLIASSATEATMVLIKNLLTSKPLPAGVGIGGTITTPSVVQTVAGANASRAGLTFQNTSDTNMWISEDGNDPAIGTSGYLVEPSQCVSINTNKIVKLICATGGKTFAATEF